MYIYIGLGTGRFGLVLAFLATRPVPIGFGVFQPAILVKLVKSPSIRVGWGGLCRQVGWVGHVGWVFLGATVLKFKIQIS
jgi:hypothetical protein